MEVNRMVEQISISKISVVEGGSSHKIIHYYDITIDIEAKSQLALAL
jgi:hypothetical protein